MKLLTCELGQVNSIMQNHKQYMVAWLHTLTLCCRWHKNEVSHLVRKLGSHIKASFLSRIERSTLLKALEKSVSKTLTVLLGESNTLANDESALPCSAWTAEVPRTEPNWSGSMAGVKSSVIQSVTNICKHFERTGVYGIGLKWFSNMDGVESLGRGANVCRLPHLWNKFISGAAVEHST